MSEIDSQGPEPSPQVTSREAGGVDGPDPQASRTMSRASLACSLLFGAWAFAVLWCYPVGLVHPDVIWRARVLQDWKASMPTNAWHFAHLLEVPSAKLVQVLSAGALEPLEAFRLLQALAGAATVGLLTWAILAGTQSFLLAAGGAATLLASHGFWRICAGGEERGTAMLAILAIVVASTVLVGPRAAGPAERRPTAWLVILAVAVALGVLSHLVVAAAAAAVLVLPLIPGGQHNRRQELRAALATLSGLGVAAGVGLGVCLGPLGLRSFEQVAAFFLRYHGRDGFFLHSLGGSPGNYAWRLAGGWVSSFTFNPLLWETCEGILLWFSAIAIPIVAGWLCSGARRALGRSATVLLLLSGLWTAHFLLYEPYNLESWVPILPVLVFSSLLGLKELYGSSRRGRWTAAAVTLLLPCGLAAMNLPVWSSLHRESPLVAGPRSLGPCLPARSLLICGWQGWACEDSYWMYHAPGRDLETYQLERDSLAPGTPAASALLQRIRQARVRGRSVLVTSSVLADRALRLPVADSPLLELLEEGTRVAAVYSVLPEDPKAQRRVLHVDRP